MKNVNQKQIADKAGISSVMLSLILSGKRRAGWRTAKKLSTVTSTDPVLWLEGTVDQIKDVLSGMDISNEK